MRAQLIARPFTGQDVLVPSFVVQEHHATALHWDVRLERDGVLVSWAVPKGLPLDPQQNRLAKKVGDHELQHGSYESDNVTIWDTGTYEVQTWTDDEVKVVLHGSRVEGRYVFIRTGGKRGDDWLVHRMDGAPAGWSPLPRGLSPMLATSGTLPRDDEQWAYEVKWDGARALVAVDGGRLTITTRNGNDVTSSYPELRALGLQLGSTQVLLDAEVVAFDEQGRADFGTLQNRLHVGRPSATLQRSTPVQLVIFDLLHLDGISVTDLSYDDRRALLEGLDIVGDHWQVPPAFLGGGTELLEATRLQGLEGIVAKRRDSRYVPGRRSDHWLKLKHLRRMTAVICGWRPGDGGRAGRIGSLLLGVHGSQGLEFVGRVGTGFTAAVLTDLQDRLEALRREGSPYDIEPPREDAKGAVWVAPELVCEVDYGAVTKDGKLRFPSYKGLRIDYAPTDVVSDV